MRATIFLFLLGLGCSVINDFEAPIEAGPQCSDGVDNDGDGLQDCEESNCREDPKCLPALLSCGDGILDDGEECDDANQDDSDACLSSCWVARCGDGFVQVGLEECDDANQSSADICTNLCQVPLCGDGFVQAGVEECDDGNDSNQDSCGNDCRVK